MKQLFKPILFTTAILFGSSMFNKTTAQRTCGTMQAIYNRMQTDSNYRKDFEKKEADLDAYLAEHPVTESFATGDTIIIPVVVHIVLSNPYLVTDDNVDYFINRLNEDFSGFNADSTDGSPFYGVRGHALFRFALARRDVNGNSTTGIERKVSAATIAQTTFQAIKTAASGLPPWDITKYYNLWVGDPGTTGLLGIAPQIGPGTQSGQDIDGICCNYKSFSSNACYSDPLYALARTSIHEIGHNFGLYHTFQGACSSKDFSTNLSSPGKALPSSLLAASDDTPPTSAATYGTSSGGVCSISQGVTNGCTPAVPKMYQNFMDYTDDPCMNMFTIGQVKRMHYVVENFRTGYLTTKGHLPPDGTPQNEAAANSIVSPGGVEVIACNSKSYPTPTCGNGTFIPKLKVTSYGVNNLTSITVNLDINGVNVASQTFATNLGAAKSAVFTLPSQTLSTGTNVLKFYTTNPNGVIDSIPTNDTITKTIVINNTIPSTTTLPLFEGFENAAFAPTTTGWAVNNATSGTNTFTRSTTAFKTGVACTTIKLFGNTASNDIDYLTSPRLNFGGITDSVFISFNYAYRIKGTAAATKKDTLSVEVSTDCDPTNATWIPLWKKGGDNLKTTATAIATNWTAAAADWTSTPIKISLQNYKDNPIYIAFKSRNGNGQNIFIDDINIYSVPAPLPIKLSSFAVQQNEKIIVCKWETLSEENVANFIVERSIDGNTFENIGNVAAVGNSANKLYYQFVDNNAYKQPTKQLFYRLKMNDKNGTFNYSKVVMVRLGEKQLLHLYPNPAKNVTTLSIVNSSVNTSNSTIQIVDYLGRILHQQNAFIAIGNNAILLNTASLPQGNFVVMVKSETEVKTLKLVKE